MTISGICDSGYEYGVVANSGWKLPLNLLRATQGHSVVRQQVSVIDSRGCGDFGRITVQIFCAVF